MQLKSFFLFCFIIIFTITEQVTAAVNDPILKGIKPGTITIIGYCAHLTVIMA